MVAQSAAQPPAPPPARLVRDVGTTPREQFDQDEWLLTTGHGGFATGTLSNIPTRQYHNLLMGASAPPVGRIAAVQGIEETITTAEGSTSLARYNFQVGGTTPGPSHLVQFIREPASVTWVYQVPGACLKKTLHLGWQSNKAAVRYTVESKGPVTLALRPRIKLNDFHERLDDMDTSRFTVTKTGSLVRVDAAGQAVSVCCSTGEYREDPHVTSSVDYAVTRTREAKPIGEPLWSPGVFTMEFGAGEHVCTVAFALAPDEPDLHLPENQDRTEHLKQVHERAAKALGSQELADRLGPLIDASDDYLVTRKVGERRLKTVIAGYPWFADWGRDTMISMPGLMFTTGRLADARSCLETFASWVSEGMIPNRFDDNEAFAHYNTVDASLWYLEAIRAYSEASGESLQASGLLLDAAKQIIKGYESGTRYGIASDPADGLVKAGDANTQLTWMDALRDGIAFTPRYGKCVEINALWINGLRSVAQLLEDEDPKLAAQLHEKAQATAGAFVAAFVRPDGLGLFDRLQPDESAPGGWKPIAEIRPNQLFAVSLKHGPLGEAHKQSVLAVCRDHLLTPMGLRTLAPQDPAYRGRFKGDMMARDAAYHNGTVWPWLIGTYCEAVLRVGNFSDAARTEAAKALEHIVESMNRGCLGQIVEILDGDDPRDEEGCNAQAWSVAEALRISALIASPTPRS